MSLLTKTFVDLCEELREIELHLTQVEELGAKEMKMLAKIPKLKEWLGEMADSVYAEGTNI